MPSSPTSYLDANAGIPPLPQIREKLPGVLGQLYNPSSTHQAGRQAKALLRTARTQVTRSLGTLLSDLNDSQWIWTSGGTEGLQAAIRSTVLRAPARVWFYSAVEHSGSLGWLSQIEKNPDCKAIALPLDAFGRVNVDAFPKAYENACQSGAIRPGEAFLASFLWVHNETGIVQDRLTELLQAIQERGGYSLIDAAQSWGKIGPGAGVSLALADWVAASGHKLGAFSGTGVLAFSARARKLLEQCPSFAGTQQFGLRAGTENLVGAWSLGEAAELQAWNQCADLARLRNALEDRILFEIPASVVQGKGVPRAGNTLNVSFHEIPKTSLPLTDLLDLEGFCVSSGSACSSGVRKPSHVLKTLGYSDELALATLRISLTPETSEHELIEKFLPALKRAVAAARKAR